ncbi:MAG: NUDIX hydrolase [Candidatus Cybelea sp.]
MGINSPFPTVIARRISFECPWFILRCKDVLAEHGTEEFFVLECPDFVCTCARTPTGLFPLVRQYRPSVEQLVWEFPAGTVDDGEDSLAASERELYEETGHRARRTHVLGAYAVDYGRLSKRVHCFFSELNERDPNFTEEFGIHCDLFSANEIDAMVRNGDLAGVQHVALWHLVRSKGLVDVDSAR